MEILANESKKLEDLQLAKVLVSNIFSKEYASWLDIEDPDEDIKNFLLEEITFNKPPEEKVAALMVGLELLGINSVIKTYRAVTHDRIAGDFTITLGGTHKAFVWFDYFT